MNSFEIAKYIDMALRRKWLIILPFLASILLGMSYLLITPKTYQAQTLILVVPQEVPQNYVRSVVSIGIEDRLRTIQQQVTSRTNLENIIKEVGLFEGEPQDRLLLEEKVEIVRKNIEINVARGGRGGDAFSISFSGKDPEKVMQVTNTLASNFISENLKIRESQAMGTSSFLADELESVKNRLMKKEEELKEYRERYMGGLPEQLQTNLTILERLQNQLDQQTTGLRDAENRRILIESQIADSRNRVSAVGVSAASTRGEPAEVQDLASLKNQLASLKARYTENHPDIVHLKETIASLEKQQAELAQASGDSIHESGSSISARVDPRLLQQQRDVRLEIQSLKTEIKKTQSQIVEYQKKVEDTPKREQELLALNRDYENLKELYNSMLNRKLEAEIAVSMERKQKGEQFRVIDPAKMPQKPIKPDARKIALMTLVLGLGLGGGLAFLMDMMDTSYKAPEDVEKELKLPVLMTMPVRYTDKEVKSRKLKSALAYTSVTVGFFVCAISILFATKGVDTTISFFMEKFKM